MERVTSPLFANDGGFRPSRLPLVPVVVGLGLVLTVAAWFGLRSVETSQAEVDYERRLLGQSTELQSELESFSSSVDGLRALLDIGQDPTDAQLDRLVESVGLDGGRIIVVRGTGGRSAGSTAVIEHAIGVEDAESLIGSRIDSEGLRQATLEAGVLGETVVVDSAEVEALFGTSQGDSLTLLGTIGATETESGNGTASNGTASNGTATNVVAPGVVISQLDFGPLFDRVAAASNSEELAVQLSIDDEVVASSLPVDQLGDSFGSPVVFTQENALWAIQGFQGGLEVTHRSSTLALGIGAILAAMAGVFARATRRHAITLGRLERSEHDARHDDLTGLLNRQGLTERLTHDIRDRRGGDLVGVLFLDLDRLKVVNDSIGHSAGDEVLVAVSDRLKAIVRDGDIIGRFGGDEFVVVSSGAPAISDLTGLADRVLESLKEPAVLSDESSQMISASIGIAYVSKGEATAEDLLRDADVAMYQAKEKGGSRYEVFDSELRAKAVARLEVERELRRAIRTGQLVVHYQPIVDVETGQVDRLEALVRWQHPERGMIAPGAFLTVAAESGLIVDVGEHVLRESCRQVALWSAAIGRDVMVSVNVAERQLIDNSLLDTVRRVLAETGIKPSQLELEITEELIVDRLDHRLQVLYDLVDMGIKLAIDDFGTSRASLGQLKKLDMVSTLKIDRAFVIDVATDVVDRKIVTAIVALADSVGMEVVAEGVEDADQAAVLRGLGVDLIQGFYFHKPGGPSTISTVLTRRFDVPDAADFDAPVIH